MSVALFNKTSIVYTELFKLPSSRFLNCNRFSFLKEKKVAPHNMLVLVFNEEKGHGKMHNHTMMTDHRNVKHGFKLAPHIYLSKLWYIFRETEKKSLSQ